MNAVSDRISYLGLSRLSNIIDQGVTLSRAPTPLSQNKFSITGLNPDSIDTFFSVVSVGNPDVECRFQNKRWGGRSLHHTCVDPQRHIPP